jgi:NIMA (never in mitosis gene a)-related kinase
VLRHEEGTPSVRQVKIGQMKEKEKENALNEVRILASISHPNIVNYRDAFFDDRTQTLCVVM